MNVLIVSQYFWPENFPINDIARLLAQKGLNIDVLTGKPNYPEGIYFTGYKGGGCQKESWGDINIYRVPLMARGRRGAFRLVLNYLSFIVSGCLLAPWLLRGRKYDAIFVYAPSPLLQAIPALFLGFLKRSKVTVWVQDLWPESLQATGYVKNKFLLRCVAKVVGFIYRHTDLLLVQSKAFQQNIDTYAPGKKAVYFPNSADAVFSASPAVMDNNTEDKEVPVLGDGFSVVFAGNVGAAQAVEVIVDAAERLQDHKDISFFVFGTGSRWNWLAEESQRRGLKNLHLPGRVPVERMPEVMRRASVLLVTLTSDPIFALTVPSKIQAYMAVGRPIIACLDGEGATLIEEARAGISVPAENSTALADAVLQIVSMTAVDRERLAENGRAFYREHFDREKLVDQLILYLSGTAQETEEWQ